MVQQMQIVKNRYLKILYISLLTASLIAMAYALSIRFRVESENKSVEFVLDYKELVMMADQSDQSLDWWIAYFRQIGFQKVALEHETINSLIEEGKPITKILMTDVIRNNALYQTLPAQIKEDIKNKRIGIYDVLINTNSEHDKDRIVDGMSRMYNSSLISVYSEAKQHYILIKGQSSDSLYLNINPLYDAEGVSTERYPKIEDSNLCFLGIDYDPVKISKIQAAGMKVLARPLNAMDRSEKLVSVYLEDLSLYNMQQDYILFSGGSVIGYDGENITNLSPMIQEMEKEKTGVGLIETFIDGSYIKQEGLDVLASKLNYDVVRVFPMSKYMQKKYGSLGYEGAEEVENTLFRGIVERGVRSIYFRPFLISEAKYVTDAGEYKKMMERLEGRLQSHHITIGSAGRYATFTLNRLVTGMIGVGVIAVGIFLISLIFSMTPLIEGLLLIIGSIGSIGMAYALNSYYKILFSFTSSVIFPVLALTLFTYYLKLIFLHNKTYRIKNVLIESVIVLTIGVVIALAGGLFVGSLLTDMKYIAKIDSFRGVKAGQILGIGSFLLVYLINFGTQKEILPGSYSLREVGRLSVLFLDEKIKMKHVLISVIAAIAGYIYISRTGNESTIKPSDVELLFRNFLEYTLLARPRTKEFLAAFPALICLVYFAKHQIKWAILPLGFVVAMGLASIPNTFSHIGAPLYMSLYRTVIGAVFGLVIGIAAVLVFHFIDQEIFHRNLKVKADE